MSLLRARRVCSPCMGTNAVLPQKVMIFGDPNNGDPVGNISADKVMVICHQGDLICRGTILVLPPHLNYQRDAPTAAKFIASIVQ